MTGEPIITAYGNLTADPELRYTPSGSAVANFTIAQTPRFFDRQANERKDGETLFFRCSAWREMAENVAESLTKGSRVVAMGRMKARSFEDKEGSRRTSWEIDVDEIGPSLRFATAQVQKVSRNNTQPQQQSGFGGGFGGQSQQSSDPWGGQHAGAGWATSGDQPPPF